MVVVLVMVWSLEMGNIGLGSTGGHKPLARLAKSGAKKQS